MTTLAEQLSVPLKASEIEFRAGSVNNGGWITLMAYKTARTDIQRLNDVLGVGNWQRSHREFRGNIYCIIKFWNKEIKEWVTLEDVGFCKESSWDKSIQIKGEASDAFKRAGTNLGIGIELYTYPTVKLKLQPNEFEKGDKGGKAKTTWDFDLKEWSWYSEFDDDNKMKVLAIKDATGKRRFTWKEEVHE